MRGTKQSGTNLCFVVAQQALPKDLRNTGQNKFLTRKWYQANSITY